MIAIICLMLLSSLGRCQAEDPLSGIDIESSINRTIEEVERQVHADPNLPRLTRHEIVGILRNITAQDLNEYKDKETLERARNLYQRALMVVLPFNAEESPGSMKDLFARPPVTRIIPDDSDRGKDTSAKIDDAANDATNPDDPVGENLVGNPGPYKTGRKEATTSRNRYKNHRDSYSDVRTKVPPKETLKLDGTPIKFSFNLDNLQKKTLGTETPSTTRYPVYRPDSSTAPGLDVVYSTSDDSSVKSTSNEIAANLGTPKANQNVLTSSQWRYNAPPSSATLKPTLPSTVDKKPFLPTVISRSEALPEALPAISSAQTTPAEETSSELTLAFGTEKPVALYVTPMSSDTYSKVKYSSTYSMNSAGFRQSTPATEAPMRPEVMDLLASIGLRPDNSSNVEDVYEKNKSILESKARIPDSGEIRGTISGLAPIDTDVVSIGSQNTFESQGSEIKKGVENLSPDVQLLFQRFGLQTSFLDQSTTTTTPRSTVHSNSYTNFKPFPTSSVKDVDFREFLAQFGLDVRENRSQKSLKQATPAPSLIDAVPDNMVGILRNIGLIGGSQVPKRKAPEAVLDMEPTETKFHVFKPHEVTVKDAEQRNRINELLDTVKLVQEGKTDVRNVKKAADDLLRTTKFLKDGPDPLKLEEIIRNYNDDAKNEVKRQQQPQEPGTTVAAEETTLLSTATTESTETTASTPASTDAARDASDQSSTVATTSTERPSTTAATNLMALEESFGGTTREPDPVLPPKRKSGLYFLVDWNTFLEVGDGDEKVNLRFQPKVGDRTRFLPVTVP